MRTLATCVAVLLLVPGSGTAGETSARVRVLMGHEYDTNAERICSPSDPEDPSPPPSSDSVIRLLLEGTLGYSTGRHHLIFNYLGGAKMFLEQSEEDLLANKLAGAYQFSAARNWQLGGRFTLHDSTLRQHDRDYLLARGELFQRVRLLSWANLEVHLGGDYYLFKPDEYAVFGKRNFSYFGPVGGFRLRLGDISSVQTTFFYQLGVRFVDDKAQKLVGEQFEDKEEDRLDLRHTGGLRVKHPVSYWGGRRMILEMSYMVSVNDTNSAGSAAVWHRLRLVVSLQLPLDINLHVMGTLQFTDYRDIMYLEKLVYEPNADENENSLVVRIGYHLWEGLSLVLHGAVYRNDFHSGAGERLPFERETIMLGLAYDWSN